MKLAARGSRLVARGTGGGRKEAQKAAQYPAESGLLAQKAEPPDVQKGPDLPQDSELYENVHKNVVGATGLEPVTSSW